jgi:hypothetical protein
LPAAQELAQTVAHYWERGNGSDLARFVHLDATDGDYMLYATAVSGDMALAMVFDFEIPFSNIRSQASHLARSASPGSVLTARHSTMETEQPEGEEAPDLAYLTRWRMPPPRRANRLPGLRYPKAVSVQLSHPCRRIFGSAPDNLPDGQPRPQPEVTYQKLFTSPPGESPHVRAGLASGLLPQRRLHGAAMPQHSIGVTWQNAPADAAACLAYGWRLTCW